MGVGELPDDLAQARSRFETWRGQRRSGERLPEALWRLAVRLVRSHGVTRTARALGVGYYGLKKRREAAAQAAAAPAVPPAGPAFVELPTPAVLGKQCLFELDNSTGARMRLQLVGYDAQEIGTLARSLWSAD